MVSQEQTYLSTLEKQASDNPEEALKKIQSLVKEYPYFQALYHMGWQIAKTHGLGYLFPASCLFTSAPKIDYT